MFSFFNVSFHTLTKTTAALNEGGLSYHQVRGLYFLAVVFASTILSLLPSECLLIVHSYTIIASNE